MKKKIHLFAINLFLNRIDNIKQLFGINSNPGEICGQSSGCGGSYYGCDTDSCHIDDECDGYTEHDTCYSLDECYVDTSPCVEIDKCTYDNACGWEDTARQPCPPADTSILGGGSSK